MVTLQTTLYDYLYNDSEEYWIKDYCTNDYKNITFNDFWSDCVDLVTYKPNSGYSVYLYEKYFIGDSVIREHIFEALSIIFKVNYREIYDFVFNGDIGVIEKIKYNLRKAENRKRQVEYFRAEGRKKQIEYFYKDRNIVSSEISKISRKNNYEMPDYDYLQDKYNEYMEQIKNIDDEMRYIESRFEDVNYHTECDEFRQRRLNLYKEILDNPYY